MFVANLPPIKSFVDARYLTQGEVFGLWPCYWIGVKSVPGYNYSFEVYLPEMGAVYDKLPIAAFCHKDVKEEKPFHHLQMWDCMAWGVQVIDKHLLHAAPCTVMFLDGIKMAGNYVLTLDAYSPLDIADTGTAHTEEHKSHNLIELENGQYCLAPNNRILWDVVSITNNPRKMYPLKLQDKEFISESFGERSFGDANAFDYKK